METGSIKQGNESQPMNPTSQVRFVSTNIWQSARPHIMIVACSDGRYQQSLDEFLHDHLGITHYDRLFAPGGPGTLASSALSYVRGEMFREEAAFLIEAHKLEQIIFIFHGPVDNAGPLDSTCADYLRKTPGGGTQKIYTQQEIDLKEAVAAVVKANKDIKISAYRAEVRADMQVEFVQLDVF